MAAPRKTQCRTCQADVFFVKNRKTGKTGLVNVQRWVVWVPDEAGSDTGTWVSGYVSHHATCPQAGQWRKGRRQNG